MNGYSTLSLLILKVLRMGVRTSSVCIVLFLAIELWKDFLSGADHEMSTPDYMFILALLAILAGSLALAQAIGGEIRKMETISRDGSR